MEIIVYTLAVGFLVMLGFGLCLLLTNIFDKYILKAFDDDEEC